MTPERDEVLDDLARFITNELNTAYREHKVVETYRTYDAFQVPNQGYPLLKVFRTSDRLSFDDSISDTNISIAYCLLAPTLEMLPGLTKWVTYQMRAILQAYSMNLAGRLKFDQRFSVRYRTLYQLGEIIYQLDFDLSLQD